MILAVNWGSKENEEGGIQRKSPFTFGNTLTDVKQGKDQNPEQEVIDHLLGDEIPVVQLQPKPDHQFGRYNPVFVMKIKEPSKRKAVIQPSRIEQRPFIPERDVNGIQIDLIEMEEIKEEHGSNAEL